MVTGTHSLQHPQPSGTTYWNLESGMYTYLLVVPGHYSDQVFPNSSYLFEHNNGWTMVNWVARSTRNSSEHTWWYPQLLWTPKTQWIRSISNMVNCRFYYSDQVFRVGWSKKRKGRKPQTTTALKMSRHAYMAQTSLQSWAISLAATSSSKHICDGMSPMDGTWW